MPAERADPELRCALRPASLVQSLVLIDAPTERRLLLILAGSRALERSTLDDRVIVRLPCEPTLHLVDLGDHVIELEHRRRAVVRDAEPHPVPDAVARIVEGVLSSDPA